MGNRAELVSGDAGGGLEVLLRWKSSLGCCPVEEAVGLALPHRGLVAHPFVLP